MDEADEEEAEEERTEEVEGVVLVGDDAEIGTLLLSRQLQVDLTVGGDVAHLLVLQHLELTAKANDDIGPDGFRGLQVQ